MTARINRLNLRDSCLDSPKVLCEDEDHHTREVKADPHHKGSVHASTCWRPENQDDIVDSRALEREACSWVLKEIPHSYPKTYSIRQHIRLNDCKTFVELQ